MGERKVLNKYYPPDFNPEKLEKNKRPKDKQDNVRMMLPMSMRCSTCGNYLYIGTKFNMRKETCLDEHYLNIKIYRFYLKCTQCYAEVTFKTDPKNSDYVVEHGAARNYEPWRDAKAAEELLMEMKENEEEGNAMKFLENITFDSKRELDILDALDEIKHLNRRKEIITADTLLEAHLKANNTASNNNIDEQEVQAFKNLIKFKRIAEEEEKAKADEDGNKSENGQNHTNNQDSNQEKSDDLLTKRKMESKALKPLLIKKKQICEAKPDDLKKEEQPIEEKRQKIEKNSSKEPKKIQLCDYSDED
jgi:hypothetical protein